MYFNDINILYYVLFAIIGLAIGQIVDYCNTNFLKERKILSKQNIKEYIKFFEPKYLLMITIAIIYIGLIYKFGIHKTFEQNLNLIRYIILTPMLISALIVDFKIQIIPNRLTLTMFEIGLIFTFIYGFFNINIAMDMFLGMLAGGLIFLAITLIGGLIAGREAMGLGDVKLMGALGLFFGLNNIIILSVLAFLIGAIISIILMITRKNKSSDYIPFGPFIVIASGITIFVPFDILFFVLMKIFSLGLF